MTDPLYVPLNTSLAQKKCFVTADVCYAHSWQNNARVCHFVGSFVSLMRVGLSARVVLHHSQPRVRRRDARDTAAWKAAAAATRWAAARLEGYRRGPGPQHAAPDEAAGGHRGVVA